MIRLALIGFGYWGPNLLRNFLLTEGCKIIQICDIDTNRLRLIKQLHPDISTTTNASLIFKDSSIDAVIVATPPSNHYFLTSQALLAGKDVLVEKPMTTTVEDAERLVTLSEKKKKILMVDHTFIYSSAVEKIYEIIKKKILGRIVNIDSVRINLGLYQRDINVIEDLAVHDFTILDYLIGRLPKSVKVIGAKHFDPIQLDQAYLHLWYPSNMLVNINVSWLSPIKIRRMIICGTERMLVYDDLETFEKIKIFDTGIKIERDPKEIFQMKVGYRQGDVYSPNIGFKEPLAGVASNFLESIRLRKKPRSDGYAALRVVKVLDMALRSMGKYKS